MDPVVFQELQNAELALQIRQRQRTREHEDAHAAAEDRAHDAEMDIKRLKEKLTKVEHDAACTTLALRLLVLRNNFLGKIVRRLSEQLGPHDGKSCEELFHGFLKEVDDSAARAWDKPGNQAKLEAEVSAYVEHFKRTVPLAR